MICGSSRNRMMLTEMMTKNEANENKKANNIDFTQWIFNLRQVYRKEKILDDISNLMMQTGIWIFVPRSVCGCAISSGVFNFGDATEKLIDVYVFSVVFQYYTSYTDARLIRRLPASFLQVTDDSRSSVK